MTATPAGPGQPMRLAALWGDQHARPDQSVVTRVDERSALAVSAGPAPGSPVSAGPNEDAALVLATPYAQLLAVAGGEDQLDAARAALLAVAREGVRLLGRTRAGATLAGENAAGDKGRRAGPRPWRRPSGGLREHEAATSLTAALHALLDAARMAADRAALPEPAGGPGHTALGVALVAGGSVSAATLGGASVIRLHGHTAETLTMSASGPGGHATLSQPVSATLSAGDRLVLATDGFLDRLGERWPRLVMAAVGSGSDPSGATSRLLQAASTGGVRRDVAVALTSVAGASPNGGGPGTDDALELVVPAG